MHFSDSHFLLSHYFNFLLSQFYCEILDQCHNLVLLSILALMNIFFPKLISRFFSDNCSACL